MTRSVAEPLGEPGGDRAAVLVVAGHAEVQRLGAAQREPRVERAGDGARGVEDELQPRREIVVVQRRRCRRSCREWPFRYFVVEW